MFVCWFVTQTRAAFSSSVNTDTKIRCGQNTQTTVCAEGGLGDRWLFGSIWAQRSAQRGVISSETEPSQLIFCYLCAQHETLNCKHFTLKRNLNSSAVVRVFYLSKLDSAHVYDVKRTFLWSQENRSQLQDFSSLEQISKVQWQVCLFQHKLHEYYRITNCAGKLKRRLT